MDTAKKGLVSNAGLCLLLTYLALFPFGQLLRIDVFGFAVQPIDIVASFSLLFLTYGFDKRPRRFIYIENFLLVCLFTLIISLNIFTPSQLIIGSLYLLRLIVYYSFSVLTFLLLRNKIVKKEAIIDLLITAVLFISIFGIIQYLYFLDLTSLKYVGWDDHLGRMVSTLLDPTYTGILLVFGFITSFVTYQIRKRKWYLAFSLLFICAIALTYSRASYLSLIAALMYLKAGALKVKKAWLIILIFLLFLPLLPRFKSEGVRLERTASISARVKNYQETLTIFGKYPLFGVGFNNICVERMKIFGGIAQSHACSGADSSILFIAATTGTVGVVMFFYMIISLWKQTTSGIYGQIFKASIIAVLVHSLFSNSLFYPWVMGYLALLFPVSIDSRSYGSK